MNTIEKEFVANQEANNTNTNIEVDYDEELHGWYCQDMNSGNNTVVHGGKWMTEQEVKAIASELL